MAIDLSTDSAWGFATGPSRDIGMRTAAVWGFATEVWGFATGREKLRA
jgi:hypothetical protein